MNDTSLRTLLNPAAQLLTIWRCRYFLRQLTRRNIEARFKGSFLGFLWLFILPLMMLGIYTFVFSVVFKAKWGVGTGDGKAAFAVIMFCGMSVYNIFSEAVGGSSGLIVGNPNYVKKVVFPLEMLPLSHSLASLIFGLAWFVLLLPGACLVFGKLSFSMLFLPLTLFPLWLFSCGISFFVASLGVYIRDVQYVVGVILQVLFYLTPVFYPIGAVPDKYRWMLMLNPMTHFIEETRNIFLYGRMLSPSAAGLLFAIGALSFYLGFVWFGKTKKGFADVL